MTLRHVGLALLTLLIASACFAQSVAKVLPVQTPVMVDGALTEPCWQQAPALAEFHPLGKPTETVKATTVRLAHDQTWLYLAFNCAHPNLRALKPACVTHDGPVHTDESVEIFVCPSADAAAPYFHYKLNLLNVKAEQRATAAGSREARWDEPWLSAVKQRAGGWDAEIALPLYVLASYGGDLSQARINFTRNQLLPVIDRQNALTGYEANLSTWSPLQRTFHEPDLFGTLTGLAITKLQVPFLASFSGGKVSGYRFEGEQCCYDVTVDVRGHNDRAGQVKLAVTDTPVTGKATTMAQTLELQGMGAPRAVTVTVPVAAPAQRSVTVALCDAASGSEFGRAGLSTTAALELLNVYLDRNYYTTETQATVICHLGLPEASLRGSTLTVRDAAGRALARNAQPTVDSRLAVPIANLPVGRHALSLRWDRGNALLFEQSLDLVKRAPKPGREWKIDHINRVVLKDGKPYFPFGLIMYAVKAANEADFAQVQAAGFNTIVHWAQGVTAQDIDAYMQVAREHNLNVVVPFEAVNRRGVDREILAEYFAGEDLERVVKSTSRYGIFNLKGGLIVDPDLKTLPRDAKSRIFTRYCQSTYPEILEVVRVATQYDNCLGFDQFDEPILSLFDEDVPGRELYHKVLDMDGYHPIFLLYSSYIPEGDRAVDWADLLGTDPYWIPGGEVGRNTPNFVSKITATTVQRGEPHRQPTWIVPVGETWSGMHKRSLLPAEQYCQTYLALIHGAKALFYFRYPVGHAQSWEALSEMARQLRVLGPIVVSEDLPQEVAYDSGRFDPASDSFPDVQVSLRRNPGGGCVLLAANSRPYPVQATFTLPALGETGPVGRLFSEQRYELKDGCLSEMIEGYGTRAYTFPASPPAGQTVQIKVKAQGKAETVAAEVAYPRTGRAGKKNILPNPSFEEASLRAWPDYIRTWYSVPSTGLPDPGCGQDADAPFHGKYCLRITRNQPGYNGIYFYITPQHSRPTRYVFSMYLKGSRDGLKVAVGGGEFPWKTAVLTTQWQRVFVAGTVPARADRETMMQIRLMDEGRMWVDAMQFEQGEEPTEFEE